MAVPFYVPDEDDQRENSSSSQPPSTTTSATQTPLQSPMVYNEHLVQVFYEALSLYSANLVLRTPCTTTPPSSPSCCFPRFFSHPQKWRMPRHENLSPRNEVPRRRLNSTGEEVDEDVHADFGIPSASSSSSSSNNSISTSSSNSGNSESTSPPPTNFNLEEHYRCLAARERLQQFPGQVPQRKKKVTTEEIAEAESVKTEKKPKSKEQNFVWPTVVTAVVLAVGYITSR